MTERQFIYRTPIQIYLNRLVVGQAIAAAPNSLALGTCAITDVEGQVATTQQMYCTPQDRENFPELLPAIQAVLDVTRPYISDSDYTRALCWLSTWAGVQFL
jgi:hypothetical protein